MQTSSTQTAPKCNDAIEELVKKDIVNQETAEKAFKKLALTGVEVEYRVRRPGQESIPMWRRRAGFPILKRCWQKQSLS